MFALILGTMLTLYVAREVWKYLRRHRLTPQQKAEVRQFRADLKRANPALVEVLHAEKRKDGRS